MLILHSTQILELTERPLIGVPVKCETKQKRNETKQIETKRNKSKRNETDRNETKQIETKRNKSKRNETSCMERQIDVCSIN